MKKLLILGASVFIFWSCGKSEKSQDENNSISVEDFEAQISPDLLGKPVEKFNNKLDELLTLEMASEALGLPGGDAEKDYEQTFNDPTLHSIAYKWNTGRKETLSLPSGRKLDVPAQDYVKLAWLQHSNQNKYNNTYREPTKEELAALDRILGDETEKMDLPDNVNETLKEDLGDGLASNLNFIDVSGVGDLARWNTKTNELPVYYKGISFIIQVNSGRGTEGDKDIAAEVAKKIVKKL